MEKLVAQPVAQPVVQDKWWSWDQWVSATSRFPFLFDCTVTLKRCPLQCQNSYAIASECLQERDQKKGIVNRIHESYCLRWRN